MLASAIGVGGTSETERFVADCCIALGITNIRTIKRAARFIRSIESKLADFDPEVLRTAVRSLVLFCWCRDEPEQAPSLDYVETKKFDFFGLGRTVPTDKLGSDQIDDKKKVSRWSARVQTYGYIWTEDLDSVLSRQYGRDTSTTRSCRRRLEALSEVRQRARRGVSRRRVAQSRLLLPR